MIAFEPSSSTPAKDGALLDAAGGWEERVHSRAVRIIRYVLLHSALGLVLVPICNPSMSLLVNPGFRDSTRLVTSAEAGSKL